MKFSILILTLFIFGFSGCDRFSSGQTETSHHSKDQNIETFYTCPMHPQVREHEAGKCPICHMNLVKVQVDKGEQSEAKVESVQLWQCENFPEVTSKVYEVCPLDGTPMVKVKKSSAGKVIGKVKLREAQKKHFRPAFFSVSPMKMEKNIRLLGAVFPSEEKESNIPARVAGRVEKVYIESTGSYVKEGAPVLDLYSTQLITGGEEYLLARKNYKQNPNQSFKDLLRQSEERLRLWGIQQWQMNKWFKNNKVPRSITIYSPATGIVQQRNAVVGKYFKEGENFFKLSELSSVWVELDVYEHDSALVELGQKVGLNFTALPGVEISGLVDFISPVIDPASRTLKIRTTIKNPKGRLKPGMIADAKLKIEFEGKPLVVPRSAIIDTGKRKVVWIKVSDDSFQAKTVITGHESEGYVEILEGLNEGEEVVLEANFLLDAQAQLFGGYEDFKTEAPQQHKH